MKFNRKRGSKSGYSKGVARMKGRQAYDALRRASRTVGSGSLVEYKRKFDLDKTKMLLAALGQQRRRYGRR